MSFIYGNYLPFIILGWVIIVILVLRGERKFFKFVNTYWFLRRRWRHLLGSLLWLVGLLGLLLSLMDWRGPEERIKTQVPEDKTIILLDTSASMLAEDVKPSRLQKAVMLAKHLVRRAPGQQISIVAFAEVQTKIVPFTNDIDLLDARLDSVKNLRNHYGSSALTIALQESIQYFKESGDTSGNIVILTDGEETAEGIDLKIPKEIRIALVGVGTTNGGRIPLDDSRGFRFGYKKYKGKDITTKLNPNYFTTLEKQIPVVKTWILGSYSLPSDEIINFFKTEKKKSEQQQDMIVRPVRMEWIVLPSVFIFILGLILKSMTPYRLSSILVLFLLNFYAIAQEPKEEKKELSPETMMKLQSLEAGELSSYEKLKLADELQEQGEDDQAIALYKENLATGEDIPVESIFNYGTALLKKGDISQGLSIYEKMKPHLEESQREDYLKKMSQNTLLAINKKQQEQQKQDKNKKNQDQKEDDSEKQGQGGSGSNEKQDQKKKEEKKDQKGENKKDKEDKQDKKDDPKDQDDEKDDQQKEDKPKEEQKNMPPKKVSPLLKQLMSDDRQLQMKMIENGTRDLNKRHSRENKDW
ncbi:MAG: VWA domain-containing protein [Bacteriovoracaceae bacterium]